MKRLAVVLVLALATLASGGTWPQEMHARREQAKAEKVAAEKAEKERQRAELIASFRRADEARFVRIFGRPPASADVGLILARVDRLTDKNAKLSEEIGRLKAENASLKAENARLRAEISRLKSPAPAE